MTTGVNTFNYIRQNASGSFREIVPSATPDNIAQLKTILLDSNYQAQLNEFINALVNRIGLTIVQNKSFTNPLAIFKKGSVPLGTDIQEIYTNPAVAEQYELSDLAMSKLLTVTDPDTHAAYYRMNRKDLFTKTITREMLQGAFVSWEKFEEFITSITNSLYSGNYISEFKYTKDLIDGAVANGKVISVEATEGETKDETRKGILSLARNLYLKMQLPSTEYNAYSKFNPSAPVPVTTWTDPSRIVMITTSDTLSDLDVNVLAAAFNMDKSEFMGRTYVIDKFAHDEILFVICDESWLQIYDNIFRFDEFYNARTMSWNEYLHAWSTFAISPFANAVAVVSKPVTVATNISLAASTKSIVKGASTTVTVTTDSNYLYCESNNTAVATCSLVDKKLTIKGVTEGECVVTVYTDNGLKATCAVTVTAA